MFDWRPLEPKLRELLGIRFGSISEDGTRFVTNGKLSPVERKAVEKLMPRGTAMMGTD